MLPYNFFFNFLNNVQLQSILHTISVKGKIFRKDDMQRSTKDHMYKYEYH